MLDRTEVALVTATPDDPLAGANLHFLIQEDTRVLIHSIIFLFTTDANVATRRVAIQGWVGSTPFVQAAAPGDQAANAIITYHYAPCVLGIDGTTAHDKQWATISEHLYLDRGHAIATDITNMQVGDQISAVHIRYYQKLPR